VAEPADLLHLVGLKRLLLEAADLDHLPQHFQVLIFGRFLLHVSLGLGLWKTVELSLAQWPAGNALPPEEAPR
jgi:hypothetical protein